MLRLSARISRCFPCFLAEFPCISRYSRERRVGFRLPAQPRCGRAAAISADAGFRERLTEAYLAGREEYEEPEYVEEKIYSRFTDNRDQALLDRFHAAEWAERPSVLAKISDDRLRVLGDRLVYFEAPQLMSDSARRDHEVAIARRLTSKEDAVPWLTLSEAITEATDLLLDASGEEASLLRAHLDRLRQQADDASALLA